jgi:hypothetical protein
MIHFSNKAVKIILYMEIDQKDLPGFETVVIDKTGSVRINVTLRHVCITIVACKSNKYYVF